MSNQENATSSFILYTPTAYADSEIQQRAQSFYELMNKRRSVRFFSDKPIPDGVLENIILTAGTAPSGAHKQPWFFALVTSKDIKHKIRLAAEQEERKNYAERFTKEWLEDLAPFGTDANKSYIDTVPALIVVFKENYRVVDGQQKKNYYVNESVGIAAGMLIAAIQNAGLATLTHTPNPMKFLNEILDRPSNETPILLMPVGYPAEDCRVPDLKRKELTQISQTY